MTGLLLDGYEMDTDLPEERLWWGRRLGYTDEQVRDMWLSDSRPPQFIDLAGFERVMTKTEAEAMEVRHKFTGAE